MAQPTPYDRQFSFQDFQAQEPTTPLPGDKVDGELNSVKVTLDQTLVNLAKIQRDDGALRNNSVGQDQLSPSLSIGFTYRGVWAIGQNYVLSDGVSIGSLFYRAKVANLSSVGNAPPSPPATNAFWDLIADITPLGIAVNSVYTAALQNGLLSADVAGRAKMAAGFVNTALLAESVLSADVAGRAKMAAGFVNTALLAAGVLSADVAGRAKMADGFLSADAAGLAKMADGFLTADAAGRLKMANGFVTSAKLSSGFAFGQCRLTKVSTNLVLSRAGGSLLTINGAHETIPSAGVTLAATGLTPGTLYYIYAYMNTGTMTLEASTTGHSTDTTTGVEIKTGDATRTLVGLARPITGPAFADTAAQRFVISWFNRKNIAVYAQFTADRTVTAAPFTEVNTEIRNEFITWSDDPVFPLVGGTWTVTGAAVGAARVSFDGATGGFARSQCTNTTSVALVLAEPATLLSEGYHYITVEGGRTGGTNVIFLGSSNGNVSLTTTMRG